MSILVNRNTRVICQGLGKAGLFHCTQCSEYGTNIVGAVKPGKNGTTFPLPTPDKKEKAVPYFNSVKEAVAKTEANTSIIFVPATGAADAIMEAVDAGIALVICITEGVPTLDMLRVKLFMQGKNSRLIGPNCPGLISPGIAKIGIMPGYIHRPGKVGVVSRSGTLTYETVGQLTALNLGQSTCVGIGGDPIIGSSFVDILQEFQKDPETEAVVMIGEIGGDAEEKAAQFISQNMRNKPVVSFIAGQTAPPGRRMGHAGAIISGGKGTAKEKMKTLQECGIHVVESPADIGKTMAKALKK
jgi:succinyl-CoA synthetase alpha subunit